MRGQLGLEVLDHVFTLSAVAVGYVDGDVFGRDALGHQKRSTVVA